jgi:hypothetical protein
MTTRPYELLVRFAPDGTIGGCSVRTITTVNGRDFEGDPQPLTGTSDPAFAAFANQFAMTAVAELETARGQLATIQAALTAANAKIVELQTALPWNVRVIDATAFVARISQTELLDLAGSADVSRKQIVEMLLAYRANDWPILLDSPETQQAIGYLVQSGAISEERAAELLRDSSQAEAYKAGE